MARPLPVLLLLVVALTASLPETAMAATAQPQVIIGFGSENVLAGPRVASFFTEVRSAPGYRHMGALLATEVTTREQFFGIGLYRQFRLGKGSFGVSAGPGYYRREESGFDLGSKYEFRTSLEFLYPLRHGFSVGAAVAHVSNAGTGYKNPGTESVRILIAIPLSR